MPLTPADVRNKQFSTTRLRPGYDEEEVDAFLDEVEAELDRLIQENEELRGKLAEVLRGKVPAMAAPVAEPPKTEMIAPPPEPVQPPQPEPQQQPKQLEPALGGMGMPAGEDNMDTAARVLALAQQTADQAIADARREADDTVGRARREAEEILGKARRQADQIISEARQHAESLDRDAQERHRQAMGTLVQQREELERKVDDLRAFEREYRVRLKAYLEGQLEELDAAATDSGSFPTPGSAAPAVPAGPAMQHGAPHAQDPRAAQPAPVSANPFAGPESVQHGTGFHTVENNPHDRR
ncbi:MAG TPA: DivIVA domain-containing protein [Streptosporangiaceae bacterium]